MDDRKYNEDNDGETNQNVNILDDHLCQINCVLGQLVFLQNKSHLTFVKTIQPVAVCQHWRSLQTKPYQLVEPLCVWTLGVFDHAKEFVDRNVEMG